MQATSVQFAAVARSLATVARARGLVVPGFRSPPRVAGAERTLQWPARGGAPTVAVQLKGRPFGAVLADMVEGIVVANELDPSEATRARTALWEAVVGENGLAVVAA